MIWVMIWSGIKVKSRIQEPSLFPALLCLSQLCPLKMYTMHDC
jgi:hypothetical protein